MLMKEPSSHAGRNPPSVLGGFSGLIAERFGRERVIVIETVKEMRVG